jgi:hypothetical protein
MEKMKKNRIMTMFEDPKHEVPAKLGPNSDDPILRFLHHFQNRSFSFKIMIEYPGFDICEDKGMTIHYALAGRVGLSYKLR